MNRTKEIQYYLANKHKGGKNNEKGSKYEDFYTAYQIVACLAKYKYELDAVSFQAQLKDTFVDDLLIAHPDVNVYHQLKNTKSLSWGNVVEEGSIAFDFAHQKDDCKVRDENFALKLVHSVTDTKVDETIPSEVEGVTSTEWFPYQEDINRLVMISADFKSVLKIISNDGDRSTDDVLVNIACSVLGAWRGMGGKRVTLADIVKRLEAMKRVNLSIYPDKEISEKCTRILDSIDGFEYHVKGRMLYWGFGSMTGSCPWPEDMEERIIKANPKTKLELLTLL